MAKAQREKGKRGEREACEALAPVFPGLRRTYHQSRDGGDAPDVDSDACPVWIEVKRAEAINVHAAVKQAQVAAKGRRPVMVAHKRNRGEWLVTMPLATLGRLVHPAIVAKVDGEATRDALAAAVDNLTGRIDARTWFLDPQLRFLHLFQGGNE